MIRSEVLKTLIPLISDQLVVTNIGLPSQEMHLLDDQPTNFYMLGTMGLASSIGLGLAMAQTKKVIAIDGGDGEMPELRMAATAVDQRPPVDGDLVRSYLRDIGRVPLLSHEQEITLGR